MSILRRDELNNLIEQREESCVSIYLPTHRAMPETQQDPIRFKNLLAEAKNKLITFGLRSPEAKQLLEPAMKLLDDRDFWKYQSDGLAVFISSDVFRFYTLPITFAELVVVTGRFHFKPLLRMFTTEGSFYILALSQNQVRVFQGSRQSVTELFPQGIPKNLEAALMYDDPQRELQFHTRAPQMGGRRAAVFHGHGVGIDDNKDRILRYCREIDAGLRPLLRDEVAPLVLACVDYLLPIYKSANTYRHLMDEGIPGNPETLSPTELHEQAWKIVRPYFQRTRGEAIAKYREVVGTGRTSTDIRNVIAAAASGRVESLLVAVGVQQWGAVDPATKVSELHDDPLPGDEDLLDRAAIETIANGGVVFAVEPASIPDNAPLAAVYRY
ncbi:MAG TPA: hypothetical protein VJ124_01045 [Pyrinomonadaceae bacterium]|nr:hypothetical protein [Pyrinomonadaceae bacterium]